MVYKKVVFFGNRSYLDWWSFVHFAVGALLASLFLFFEVDFTIAFIVTAVVLTLYEMIEPEFWPNVTGDPYLETPSNAAADILVGFAGFFAGWYSGSWSTALILFFAGIIVSVVIETFITRSFISGIKRIVFKRFLKMS